MTATEYTILATVAVTDGSTVTTLRFSTRPYEDSAGNEYEPRISARELPVIEQRLRFPAGGEAAARASTTAGDLVVDNADGYLDDWLDPDSYGFDGQAVEILIVAPGGTPVTLFLGQCARPVRGKLNVRFILSDRSAELDRPVQTTRYEGDNALPAGLEGGQDLEGRPKVISWGKRESVPGPLVNSALLIHQVSDGEVDDVTAALASGVGFVQGTDYASEADLLTLGSAPSRGGYRLWSSSTGSYVRLGSRYEGQPLFDVVEGASSAARTNGQIVKAILEDRAGYTTADYSASDITALDSANNDEAGEWAGTDDVLISTLIDRRAAAAGAWWGHDRAGKFRIRQITNPRLETATVEIHYRPTDLPADAFEILDLDWLPDIRIPIWRMVGKYRRMSAVETKFAAVVSPSRRDLRGVEWRTVWAENTAIFNPATRAGLHLLAETLEAEIDVATRADALAEVERQFEIWSARQDVPSGNIPLTIAALAAFEIGTIATLYADRYDYTTGSNAMVTAIRLDLSAMRIGLELFGFGVGKSPTAGGGVSTGGSDTTPNADEFDPGTLTWYATSDPDADDDETAGVEVGHRWINITAGRGFECVDASDGAAVWNATFTVGEAGDLAALDTVGTGEIDANAVTDPSAATTTGGFTLSGSVYSKVQEILVSADGSDMLVTATLAGQIRENGTGATVTIYWYVVRDGGGTADIIGSSGSPMGAGTSWDNKLVEVAASASAIDSPAGNNYYYQLWARASSTSATVATVSNRTLSVTKLKR